jgi:hypothetical protein
MLQRKCGLAANERKLSAKNSSAAFFAMTMTRDLFHGTLSISLF